MSNCYFCGSVIDDRRDLQNSLDERVICPVCGNYVIEDLVVRTGLIEKEQKRKHLISGTLRRYSDAGHPITITIESFSQLMEKIPYFSSPLENLDLTLLLIMKKQTRSDEWINIDPNTEYPLVFAHDESEFIHLILSLRDLQYIEVIQENRNKRSVRLLVEGWKRAIELQKVQRKSSQAFVAMNFAHEFDEAWEKGIKPALESTGFTPYRVDMIEYNDKIDDRIIAGIRQSGLLIADFTGHRQGVYYEAGFAMGLGIPVIYMCRDTDIETAHFDTRQYKHITWSNTDDLKEKLTFRVLATIPKQ